MKGIVKVSFLSLFVVSLTLRAANAYCQTPGEGMTSFRQVKSYFHNLIIFKLSDIFYPNDEIGDPSMLPNLNKKQIEKIQQYLQQLLDSLIAQNDNAENNRDFSTIFYRQIKKNEKLKVIVSSANRPIARTDVGHVFTIDVKVIESVFRATLKDALAEISDEDFDINNFDVFQMDDPMPLKDTSEYGLFNYFFSVKKKLKDLTNKGPLYFMVKSMQGEGQGVASFGRLYFLSRKLEKTFNFVTTFVMGHELGHLVLGHLDSLKAIRSDTTCVRFRRSELEADIFATVIQLYLVDHQETTTDLQMEQMMGGVKYGNLLKRESFLSQAYKMAGFIDMDPSTGCQYPSTIERMEVIQMFNHVGSPEEATYGQYQQYIKQLK